MGAKLHAATTYKIEYGAEKKSSFYQSAINGIIDDVVSQNGCFSIACDDENPEYANNLEIKDDEFIQMLDTVRGFTEEDFQDLYNQHQEYEEMKMTKNEFIELLTELYQEADKGDGYIHLCWF